MKKYDPNKNYYAVLGVPEDATPAEIDRVFRSRAREQHPDKGGDEEEMKSLNEAHDILSDPEAREAYDSERNSQMIPHGSSVAFDPEAAARAGTLSIPLADGDLAGLILAAAACFGLGIPFLVLVEMQWVVYLWPLRLLTLGVLVIGVYMAHSALGLHQKRLKLSKPEAPAARFILYELIFWAMAAAGTYLLYLLLYAQG